MADVSTANVSQVTTNDKWFNHINRTSPELATLLRKREAELRGKAPLLLLRYRYGERCVRNGVILPPERATSDEKRLFFNVCPESQVPLLVVADRAVEITRELVAPAVGKYPNRGDYTPLAVRYPGDLIGVFEFKDRAAGIAASPGSWTVWAGSCSATLVGVQGHLKDDLLRKLGDDASGADVTLLAALAERMGCSWYAELVAVPDEWATADTPTANKLWRMASNLAWRQAQFQLTTAAVRAQVLESVRKVSALNGILNACPVESVVVDRLHLIAAVASGERPCYSPLTGPDAPPAHERDLTGPFAAVLQTLWTTSWLKEREVLASGEEPLDRRARAKYDKRASDTGWSPQKDPRYVLPMVMGPRHLKTKTEAGWITLNWPVMPELIHAPSARADDRIGKKGETLSRQVKMLLSGLVEACWSSISGTEAEARMAWAAHIDIKELKALTNKRDQTPIVELISNRDVALKTHLYKSALEATPETLFTFLEFKELGWSGLELARKGTKSGGDDGARRLARDLAFFNGSVRIVRK